MRSCVTTQKTFFLSVKSLTSLSCLVRHIFTCYALTPYSYSLPIDYHHDILNPSSIPPRTIIARANAIFARRGIRPKQHLSEPRPGAVSVMEKRAHADRVESLPDDLPDDMGEFMLYFVAIGNIKYSRLVGPV